MGENLRTGPGGGQRLFNLETGDTARAPPMVPWYSGAAYFSRNRTFQYPVAAGVFRATSVRAWHHYVRCRQGAAGRPSADDFEKERNGMNRAAGVLNREAGLRARVIFWLAKRRLGRIPLSARIQARDPKLLAAAARMSMHIARPGAVSLKLKELAQVKVAALVGCPF